MVEGLPTFVKVKGGVLHYVQQPGSYWVGPHSSALSLVGVESRQR